MFKILVQRVVWFFIAFLISLFFIRFYEYWFFLGRDGHGFILSWSGLMNDLSFSARIFIVLAIFQGGINLLAKRNFTFLLILIPSLFLLIEWSLLEYFKSSELLLDEVLYSYSFKEIQVTAGGGSISTAYILGIFVLLLLYMGVPLVFRKGIKFVPQGLIYATGAVIIVLSFLPATTNAKDEKKIQYANNKTAYFIWRSYHFYSNHVDYEDFSSTIQPSDFMELNPNFTGGKAIDKDYPYFHKLPDHSKLAEHLNPTSDGKPPNIVFLICEGLGTPFVGDYSSNTGRIMPFLDSLSEQSLYWPNFMSVCDRTYQVLPASLASVPIMRGGKMFMEVDYPAHFSLMNLLSKDYYSRFYCGTYLRFTNMMGFMKHNETDYLVQNWEDQFSDTVDGKKRSWGYPEKAVFKKSWLDYKRQNLDKKKRLDIFLTTSTHPPWKVPNNDKLKQETKALMLKNQEKYNEDYTEAFNRLDEYTTYHYLDKQLKIYFEEAQKKPDFENTLFLIYGDHGTPVAHTDDISNYKTPLLIYSPLVKQPQKFLGISTQLDLSPTLLNYLRKNYMDSLPEKVTFIGKELSFSKEYENNQSLFLATNERNDEFIMHDGYYMRHKQLFKVGKNLTLEKINNSAKYDQLYQQREYLRDMVTYTVYQDKFGPAKYIYQFIEGSAEDLTKTLLHQFEKDSVIVKNEEGPVVFVDVGDDVYLDPEMEQFEMDFSVDYKSKKDVSHRTLPKLTFSLRNDKDSTLYYGHSYYIVKNDYKPEEWNHLNAKLTFNLPKELGELNEKGKIKMAYYILNRDKDDFKMKNSKIVIYRED